MPSISTSVRGLPSQLRWFASRYKRWLLVSVVASGITSYFVFELQQRGHIPPSWWFASFFPWMVYGILVFAAVGIHRFLIYSSFKTLSIDRIVGRWFIVNSSGDLKSDFLYEGVRNGGRAPVRELRPDREGFFVEVSDYRPLYKILSCDHPGTQIMVKNTTNYVQQVLLDGRELKIFVHETFLNIDPPLPHDCEMSFHRSYDVSGTEQNSFTDKGSYAGVRIFYPTRSLLLQLIAPSHYVVKLLSYRVADERGVEEPRENAKVHCPEVLHDGMVLQWLVLYPQNDYRYSMKYRLEQI